MTRYVFFYYFFVEIIKGAGLSCTGVYSSVKTHDSCVKVCLDLQRCRSSVSRCVQLYTSVGRGFMTRCMCSILLLFT